MIMLYLACNIENSWEMVIGICAILISIISLFSSIHFNKKAKEHNIKSVLPIPYFDRSDFDNQIHIKIFNKGTGPLLINEITTKTENELGQLFELIPEPPEDYYFTNYSRFTKKEVRTVPPNSHNDLLVCKFDSDNETHLVYREQLRDFLKNIKIHCSYTDIYGSKFEDYVVDCKWYGRHKENNK